METVSPQILIPNSNKWLMAQIVNLFPFLTLSFSISCPEFTSTCLSYCRAHLFTEGFPSQLYPTSIQHGSLNETQNSNRNSQQKKKHLTNQCVLPYICVLNSLSLRFQQAQSLTLLPQHNLLRPRFRQCTQSSNVQPSHPLNPHLIKMPACSRT